jgi:dipeptidyl aminopeptidase/acylaminoacyl peptidase
MNDWKKNGFAWYKPNLKINYTFHLDSKKWIGYRAAPKIKAITLMIHGEKDEAVPLEMTKKFFARLKCQKKLIIIKRGGHAISKTFYEDRVVSLTVNWFKKHL